MLIADFAALHAAVMLITMPRYYCCWLIELRRFYFSLCRAAAAAA